MNPIASARGPGATAALLLAAGAFGAAPASAEPVEWSGSVYSSAGVSVWSCNREDSCPLTNYNNRNMLRLQLDSELSERTVARAAVGIHNTNVSRVTSAREAADVTKVQPVSVRVHEAWIEGYDVVFEGLDLRVGNQRIRWGQGDGYSPSDRLNPYDLEDPTRFDKRLPIPGVNANYHLGDFTFSLVWMPFFVSSLLADDIVDIATSENAVDNIELDTGPDATVPEIENIRTKIVLPAQSLVEMSYAARIAWAAPVADFAVGYYWGRDSLPQLSGEVIPENFFSGTQTDLIINLQYPRIQMAAADVRAPLFAGISGWAETAVIFPERTRVYISESRLRDLARLGAIDEPDGDIEAEIQTGKPYANVVAGIDRTFGDLVYVNLQYVYGFLFERNPEDLHHYTLMLVQLPSYESLFEIQLRGGAEATQAFDAFGWLGAARFSIRHDDVFRISAMMLLQNGQDGSTLRMFSPLSELRLEASANF